MISQLNQAWLASCKAIAKFGNSFAATIMPGWAAPANHATIGVAETGGGGEMLLLLSFTPSLPSWLAPAM